MIDTVLEKIGRELTYKRDGPGGGFCVFNQSTLKADILLLPSTMLAILYILALSGLAMAQFGSVGQAGSSVFFHSSKCFATQPGRGTESVKKRIVHLKRKANISMPTLSTTVWSWGSSETGVGRTKSTLAPITALDEGLFGWLLELAGLPMTLSTIVFGCTWRTSVRGSLTPWILLKAVCYLNVFPSRKYNTLG